MDDQLRIILIIIVSVSIFGLIVFVMVKNYIRNKIDYLIKEEKIKNQSNLIILRKSSFFMSITFFEVSKSNPFLAKREISFL